MANKTSSPLLPAIVYYYWNSYGGWSEIWASKYFRLALLLTVVTVPSWSQPDWWTNVLDVIPDILGFSFAGYALWQGMGNERFRDAMAGAANDGKPSPFIQVNASFVHFIVVQVLALLSALIARAYGFALDPTGVPAQVLGAVGIELQVFVVAMRLIGGAIGYLLFVYALVLVFATTFAVFYTARWFDDHKSREGRQPLR